MKIKILDLDVTVTYQAQIGFVDMPEEVYKQVLKASSQCETIEHGNMEYAEACAWLRTEISENKNCGWEIEINDMTVDDYDEIDDEIERQKCGECDGHDACKDFGCAVKLGVGNLVENQEL